MNKLFHRARHRLREMLTEPLTQDHVEIAKQVNERELSEALAEGRTADEGFLVHNRALLDGLYYEVNAAPYLTPRDVLVNGARLGVALFVFFLSACVFAGVVFAGVRVYQDHFSAEAQARSDHADKVALMTDIRAHTLGTNVTLASHSDWGVRYLPVMAGQRYDVVPGSRIISLNEGSVIVLFPHDPGPFGTDYGTNIAINSATDASGDQVPTLTLALDGDYGSTSSINTFRWWLRNSPTASIDPTLLDFQNVKTHQSVPMRLRVLPTDPPTYELTFVHAVGAAKHQPCPT